MIAHVPINAPQVVEKLDSVPVFTVTTSRARVNNTAVGLGANAAQAADWPRLAGARGSPEHGLALREAWRLLREASGEPDGRGPSLLVCHAASTSPC